jgi:bacteriocin biosynthesis cyclodehydratase domain-containing protein
MIDKPIFHSYITVRVLDPNRVLLLLEDEGKERLITGVSCGLIAASIDGKHTVDELVDQLRGRVPPEVIYYVVAKFESGGYLNNAECVTPPGVSSFWRMLGVEPEEALERLRNSTVSLTALGAATSSELEEALSRLGVSTSRAAAFVVVLTDDYLDQDLQAWNVRALSAGTAWMLGKPLGQTQWLGPIFRPGFTACWCCLAHRLRENRRMARPGGMGDAIGDFRKSHAALPSSVSAMTNLMATEIAKWLVLGHSEALEGAVWTLDSRLAATTHRMTRRTHCECCGDPAVAVGSKQFFELQNIRKNTRVEGSHRTVTVEETIRELERHVSPITGIIPIIHKAELPNSAASVYVGLQNNAISLDGPSGATGKGVTDAEAYASCLAEAVERYSCCFHGGVPRIRAGYAELAPNAVWPGDLLNFSDRQYHEREVWNLRRENAQWVPEQFKEGCEIEWTPVWSLTRQVVRYLPTAYCYFQYPGQDRRFFPSDSNGCASGNTLEEAVLQGMLELVERDAVALWWYNRTNHPSVNLASFNDWFLSSTYDNLRSGGREMHVLDLTSDLGIPCFAAVSWKADGTRIALGSAADLDPRIGVIRAVCELNQLLEFASREEASEQRPAGEAAGISHWLRTARIEEHRYLMSSGEAQARDFRNLSGSGILDDINTCRNALEGHGLETLALDMTHPDIGFPTVRVIAPGLRHFWARLGPGRLYDVPVKLGFLSEPRSEAELNPIPYML